MKKTKKAFTLIELLIVVAIIGVLAALLMPALAKSRTKVASMQTRTFLTNITSALDMYNKENGFPLFLTQSDRVNLADINNSVALVKTLSGRDPEGNALSLADKKSYNRSSTVFLSFANENLIQRGENKKWFVVDAFKNPNIYICVDKDGSGRIKKGYPTVDDGLLESEVNEIVPSKSAGIKASVIAFTLKKDEDREDAEDYSAENVYSWK